MTARSRPVLAVFGGSFNPPHVGHVLVPTYLFSRGLAQRVLVAPCWDHALGKALAPFEQRATWTRVAMKSHGNAVVVSEIEARLAAQTGEASYALNLLEAVAAEWPEWDVRLVVGSDITASGETERWHRWDRIAAEFAPIVVPRMGYAPEGEAALPAVSSTEVRALWEAAGSDPQARRRFETHVPAGVARLMLEAPRGRIWTVGQGHVGAHATRWLRDRGFEVQAVGGRALTGEGASDLGTGWPDAVWITTTDWAVEATANALLAAGLPPTVPVLHAGGATPASRALSVLAATHPVGTMHPICSLRRENSRSRIHTCGFGVEGDPDAVAWAHRMAEEQPVVDLQGLSARGRRAYHGACALLANHLSVLLAAAREEFGTLGVDTGVGEEALTELLRSATENLGDLGFPAGVSGPAARGDVQAVRGHLDALGEEAAALYQQLSDALVTRLARSRPPQQA